MRVLIFEPDYNGHHLPYARLIIQSLRRLPITITLALPTGARDSTPYSQYLRSIESENAFILDDSIPFAPGVHGAGSRADSLAISIAKHSPDHLILPYADGLGQILAIRRLTGRLRWPKGMTSEGLFLRGSFAYPTSGIKSTLKARASWMLAQLAPMTRLHHLDPLVYQHVQNSPRWSLMPDPVTPPPLVPKDSARQRLGLPTDGRLIGCGGAIDTRKGGDLLVRAFGSALPALASNDRLLLAGAHDREIKELLSGPLSQAVRSGRIISLDRFLSEHELNLALQAMDVVATPYPRHVGSASFVIRAAAGQRPVLGSDFGWVGRTVPQFGLGWVCNVSDIEAFAKAIHAALSHAPTWQPSSTAQAFVRFHTPENFAVRWREQLSSRLSVQETERSIQWPDVLRTLHASESTGAAT